MADPAENEHIVIGPQPGPQTAFLETEADIAIYGGAAGGGKSYALLLEVLRHFDNPRFGAVIFRRNSTQVRNEGGLWDESVSLYTQFGAKPRQDKLDWRFPSKMRAKFAHLEHERTVNNYQGAQIPLIGFDELTHFTQFQFFYMLSRNRSTSGVPSYVRATCNPDADSWVRKFIDWWIDKDGYPIPERSGVIRWFIRIDDILYWADTKQELIDEFQVEGEDEVMPKSVTFIPSKLQDNKILMKKDPGYLANLRALSRVERLRLEGGNWNVRAQAGTLFQKEWFPIVNAIPSGWNGLVRFWDRAATKPNSENPDPDYTRGLKMYRYPDGTFLVADLRSTRDTPAAVEKLIRNIASQDSAAVKIVAQQDPASAGKAEAAHFIRMLVGYNVSCVVKTENKVTRSLPVSAQAEVGNIILLRAPWNEEFLSEVENFPDGAHDDIVDCLSGAFLELCEGLSILDTIR